MPRLKDIIPERRDSAKLLHANVNSTYLLLSAFLFRARKVFLEKVSLFPAQISMSMEMFITLLKMLHNSGWTSSRRTSWGFQGHVKRYGVYGVVSKQKS